MQGIVDYVVLVLDAVPKVVVVAADALVFVAGAVGMAAYFADVKLQAGTVGDGMVSVAEHVAVLVAYMKRKA